MTEAARKERIESALEALRDLAGQHQQVAIRWNESEIIVPVVSLPLEAVVLNPHSHRIKAELEAHPRRTTLESDPFGDESQELIADLLRHTLTFDELKADLQENGQMDFGVITREGVLVNANTRAVALRDLGKTHVKVAVLPSDADEMSLEELEAHLQLRVERKQPYSFPNELLFIEDMKRRGKSDEDLALQLGYAANSEPRELAKGAKRVQQSIRLLSLARDVTRMSDGALPLTYFDGRRQVLQEIDEEYEKTKSRDAVAAQRVRSARLLGLVANVGYRELRFVDQKFLSDYLPTGLEENDVLATTVTALSEYSTLPKNDAVALFDVEGSEEDTPDVSVFLDAFVRSHNSDEVVLPGNLNPVSRDVALAAFASVINAAVEDYRVDKEAEGKIDQPLELLVTASKNIKKAIEVASGVIADPEFDAAAVRTKIAAVRRQLEALEAKLPAVKNSD